MGVLGIHHVTAICGDPQRNVGFYAGVLGLRLVKRTVNFDDPQTYHLYYGDERGSPGSLITFFAWPEAERGSVGVGQIAVTSLFIAPNALGFWIERLLRYNVHYVGPTHRQLAGRSERVLSFSDPDGLLLEIVATSVGVEPEGWGGGGAAGIPSEFAIRGIQGVTLWVEHGAPTAAVLVDLLAMHQIGAEDTTQHFDAATSNRAAVSVRAVGGFPRGRVSVGTVHHVAWRVPDEDAQQAIRNRLLSAGLDPTPVIDRTYFRSVYFREPGGVLFEIATDVPGFAIDEPIEQLGERLTLPPQYERYRAQLEETLPEIHLPERAV